MDSWIEYYKTKDFKFVDSDIHKKWRSELFEKLFEEEKESFEKLEKLFKLCVDNNKEVYPYPEQLFNTFNKCLPKKVKVVIIGQDPYLSSYILFEEKVPEAMGMAFSVQEGIQIPSSLKNIFKNLKKFKHIDEIPKSGDLTSWNKQGVLLLNTALTLQEGIKLSHAKHWKNITDKIIKHLSDNYDNLIFVTWGRPAYEKTELVDTTKHHIIASSHPSGLSCNKPMGEFPPFENQDHFGLINKKLKELDKEEINWNL